MSFTFWRIWRHLEAGLAGNGWPARLARALGGQQRLAVTTYRVEPPDPVAAPPLRIAFAADFHAGPLTHPALLEQACARLAEVRPDLLLLGGDFVSHRAQDAEPLLQRLGQVPAPLGRYAVLGNHDLLGDADRLIDRLGAAGIELLTNRNVRLPVPWDGIWVCGLDDHILGKPDPAAALAGADGLRVLLMHQPSGLLDLAGERVDLAFCGHTHGGQIALPGNIPIYVPEGRLSRRYNYGRYPIGRGATLLVSRGVGYTYLPLRIWSAPEIVSCTLAADAGGAEQPT